MIIIGILAAIAIPTFLAQRERAQVSTVKSDVRNAQSMVVTKVADDGTVPVGAYKESAPLIVGSDKFVPSEGVTVTVGPATGATADNYTITGKHANLDAGYSYKYDASTGKYAETGTP